MNTVKSIRDRAADTWDEEARPLDLTAYIDLLARYRWTFLGIAGLVIGASLLYAFLAKPVYRADVVFQVEDTNSGSNKTTTNNAPVAQIYDAKPAPSAELELLRSRMVVGKAVDSLKLNIETTPRYFPLIGSVLASVSTGLSTPGLFGWGGFAWGRESITVSQLEVPPQMEDKDIYLTAMGGNAYQLDVATDDGKKAVGTVGSPLAVATPDGTVNILVSQLNAHPGIRFIVRHVPRILAISRLQDRLSINELGKQSGVIGMSLEGTSPARLAATLNAIGNEYVEQNVRRKAAEAEKSLAFLESQLPVLKQQLESAEARYNAARNQRGTVDLSEESKLILAQSVQIQARLQELRQKREELVVRFTGHHPTIEILDNQIASLTGQLNSVTEKIHQLPEIEQKVLRLMRDVKVNTDLYQTLLNDVQQLKLVRASKVGTARLVDAADVPFKPVRPNRLLISGMATVAGIFVGLLAVILRHTLNGGVADAEEIEQQTGMTVYSTIPYSAEQARLRTEGQGAAGVLAHQLPDDPAMESLRGFRTALQFALLNSRNRVVLITGPAPGVGKSFICTNFAAISATPGHKIVLIDADMRRGSLNHSFGTPRSPGLSELLTGTPLSEGVQRDVVPGVDFIPTGTEPPQSADLLNNPAMDRLLDELKSRYDIVLIDTPPVLAATDAGILSPKVGAIFLVARADSTTISELTATQRSIQQAGGEIKGVLFNGLNVEGRWYRAHYRYGKYRYLNRYGTQAKRA